MSLADIPLLIRMAFVLYIVFQLSILLTDVLYSGVATLQG